MISKNSACGVLFVNGKWRRQNQFKGMVIDKRGLAKFSLILAFIVLWTVIICNLPAPDLSVLYLKHSVKAAVPILQMSGEPLPETFSVSKFVEDTAKELFSPQGMLKSTVPILSQYETDDSVSVYNEKNADMPDPAAPDEPPKVEQNVGANVKASNNISKNLAIKNETTYQVDVQSVLSEKPKFTQTGSDPLVLIVHTHGSEAYNSNGEYVVSDTDRTQDKNYNMIRVGDEMEKLLEAEGICVVHDREIHDYPSYTNSYKKSMSSIESYLKQYPSIQIVFDLHRDAVQESDGTKIKFVSEIAGEQVAQVMIVCGTDENGLEFPNWEENLRFAMQIQNKLETDYPGFARPLNLRKERFNLHETKGSLLFEIGTNGNSLEEALLAIKYLSKAVSEVIHSLQ